MASDTEGSGSSEPGGNAPLSHYVTSCLDDYFERLNGQQPNDLYRMVLDQVEGPLLTAVLNYSRGNQTRAAKILGVNRGTLRKKLRQHGID
jgi:Fis family transcriptional regulator